MVEGKASTNFIRGMLYLLPAIVLLGIFTFYPLVNTFLISFKENYNFMKPDDTYSWGFENYRSIFVAAEGGITDYAKYLINTMIIVFVSVPISILLSLLIAVALNSIKSLQRVFQTIFFLPYVTNTIAIGMVFSVMFESNQGLVNTIITFFGGDAINWLGGSSNGLLFEFASGNATFNSQYFTSLVVLLIYIVWNSLPFKILILLSALQSVDKQYYQAAQIDGTSKTRTFMKITVPLLSPQIFYLLLTSFIGAFKEYTSVVAIFDQSAQSVGQRHNMATVVWYIYDELKTKGEAGNAAAGAVVLFIIIMIFTLINKVVSSKKVHY